MFCSQALANVPSVSERTIRRHIAASEIAIGPHIQVLGFGCEYIHCTDFSTCRFPF